MSSSLCCLHLVFKVAAKSIRECIVPALPDSNQPFHVFFFHFKRLGSIILKSFWVDMAQIKQHFGVSSRYYDGNMWLICIDSLWLPLDAYIKRIISLTCAFLTPCSVIKSQKKQNSKGACEFSRIQYNSALINSHHALLVFKVPSQDHAITIF